MQNGLAVPNLYEIKSSVTSGHSCAIDDNKRLWCWGFNTTGQLGNGTDNESYYAQLVKTNASTNLANVTKVSLGLQSTCAIASGTVYCWGNSLYGESGYIGIKTYANMIKDDLGVPFTGVSEISVGQRHSCAIKSGNVWCWGLDTSGQLGNDDVRINQLYPVLVKKFDGTTLNDVAHISNGQFHTCASTTAGEAWCWGAGESGQLGDGTTGAYVGGGSALGQNRAVKVLKSAGVSLKGVSEISSGNSYTCALISGGVWCWGENNNGQFGDGTKISRRYPVQVTLTNKAPLANVTEISSATAHTCALVNHKMLCWGDNDNGQLGDGTLIDKLRAFINNL
jgi:alpha-tubulin suppressor-like RCC1 family protein